MNYRQNEAEAFESFDDEAAQFDDAANSFDDANNNEEADNLTGKRPVRKIVKKQSASFDISMANPTAEVIKIELFNELNSFVKKLNPSYVAGTFSYIPANSLEGQTAAGLGVVGFDKNGVLKITSSNVLTVAKASVTCQQFPYSGLMESTVSQPFVITRIRMTVTTDAQIDNEIIWFKSSFLGSTSQNSISPRTYFNPDQQQSKIVDIPARLSIDGTKGLLYALNAGETVKFSITIERVIR